MTENQEAKIKLEWIRQHCICSLQNAKKYERWALQNDAMPERLFTAAVIDQLEYILKTFFNDEQEPTTTPGNR